MKKGRPTLYNDAIVDALCAKLADGKDLGSVCAAKGMPDPSQIYRWLALYPEFREKYAHAREVQADVYAAQTVAIADRCREGKKTKRTVCETCRGTGITSIDVDGEEQAATCGRCAGAGGFDEVTTSDMVERSRLMIEARKWYASKLAPKKYGDRISQEISGPDGAAIPTRVEVVFVDPPKRIMPGEAKLIESS